ncbi:MAG: hypothetical protein FJX62_16100 [Alphaproteobacteria bacterium]|nr:hypothetical protein [Alphaproteobacteria bacterium]
MCMACQEMEIYYQYLDALEAEKRMAQPWQCEVILFPADDEQPQTAAKSETEALPDFIKSAPVRAARGKRAKAKAKPAAFACDTPE